MRYLLENNGIKNIPNWMHEDILGENTDDFTAFTARLFLCLVVLVIAIVGCFLEKKKLFVQSDLQGGFTQAQGCCSVPRNNIVQQNNEKQHHALKVTVGGQTILFTLR